ncbi:Abhydrolase domain-containing protein 16A [Trichostrongylus colubriformis]|uniref:Abhydrolase domain-containing protein 16A n=1 Tax=Trichostrongylus colubriformis TaxID=6319 RepID=A0AAN8FUI0_TRICO
MGRIYALLTGPRYYRTFGQPEHTPNIVESIGNYSMSLGRGLFYFSTSLAFSPILFVFLYSRGALNIHTGLVVLKYATYLAVLAYGGRLVGRTMDPEYRHFINVWLKAKKSSKSEDNQALKRYDFDLDGVNPDFYAVRNENLYFHQAPSGDGGPLVMCAAWYAVHAFGRHMLYPGSVALLNWLLSGSLLSARNLMVSAKHGRRAWLRTTEGDLIDTMYIRGEDGTPENRNRVLVITCEGNAGYYEIGIANTPAQMGYSVLGWNQPGFGQSSGLPFPNNTLAAADAVMQYAQSELGYREENIVLFGWSIGGYPASWLAANYPKVKAVILDATFDDVLPLAQARMPKVLSDIVEYAIRTHFDLNIKSILARYKGPLKLIRRLQEEILTTDDTGSEAQRRASNRANFLLKGVLQQRHPALMVDLDSQVDRWLAMTPQHRALAAHPKDDAEIAIRRARLFAACDHYLTDFDATHVQPLDPGYFNIPVPIRDLSRKNCNKKRQILFI